MNNHWLLFTSFSLFMLLSPTASSAMDQQLSMASHSDHTPGHHIETAKDRSLLSLPVATRAFVLRLVILNCTSRNDFAGVTHIIEKTKLDPGPFFTDLFERGPVTGFYKMMRLFRIGGYSYKCYKAAHEAGHKRLIRLVAEAQSLGQARCMAHYYDDRTIQEAIGSHPNFRNEGKNEARISAIFSYMDKCDMAHDVTQAYERIKKLDAYISSGRMRIDDDKTKRNALREMIKSRRDLEEIFRLILLDQHKRWKKAAAQVNEYDWSSSNDNDLCALSFTRPRPKNMI